MDYSSPQVIAAGTALLAALAAYLKSVNTAGKNAAKITELEGSVKRCLKKVEKLESAETVNPSDYRQFQRTTAEELSDQGKDLSKLVGMVQGLD